MSTLEDNKLGLTSSSTGGVTGVTPPPSLPSSTIGVAGDAHHVKQGVNIINGTGDCTDCLTSEHSPVPNDCLTDPTSPLYVDAKANFDDEDERKDDSDEASETDEKHPDSVDQVGVDNLAVKGVNIQDASDSNQPGEFVEPDEETATAVCAQVEELFSDEGVLKESYLMKHIRRNKLGFVSLKVVNSLRKMKRLTRDHRVIAYSITKLSTTLELNENSTKVRRKEPLNLPPVIKSSPATDDADNDEKVAAEFRTVVVVNLPTDTPLTIEGVAELFGKCGPVSQIRLLRPGSGALEGLGKEILRSLDKHSVVLDGGRSALIEYESLTAAQRACKKMTNKTDWRHGMRVTLLTVQPGGKKNGGEDSNNEGDGSGREGSGREGSDHKSSDRYDDFKKKKQKKKRNSRVNELVNAEALYGSGTGGGSVYSSSSDTEGRTSRWVNNSPRSASFGAAEPIAMGRRTGCPPKTGTGGGGGGSPARGSPLMAALHSGSRHGGGVHESDNDDWRARSSSFGSDLGTSPSRGSWSLRRMMQQEGGSSLGGSDATGSQILGRSSPALPLEADSVLRQPRGPDGTKGFRRDQVSRPQSGKR